MSAGRQYVQRPSSDLVWDGDLHATAFVDEGAPLTTGADVGWTPDLLVATAAGTVLMTAILRRTSEAGIEIVGYVSEQRVVAGTGNGCPAIQVSPCISVRSQSAADAVRALVAEAIEVARDTAAVSRHVMVEPRVIVASPCGVPW